MPLPLPLLVLLLVLLLLRVRLRPPPQQQHCVVAGVEAEAPELLCELPHGGEGLTEGEVSDAALGVPLRRQREGGQGGARQRVA